MNIAVGGGGKGVFPKLFWGMAERGCLLAIYRSLSRSTFDNPKTCKISCAHSAIRAAADGTPALRSFWATRPQDAPG
jgi:hypothetical protein